MLCNSMKTKAIGESMMALTIIVPTQDVYKTKNFHTTRSKENPLRDIVM